MYVLLVHIIYLDYYTYILFRLDSDVVIIDCFKREVFGNM